MISSSAHTLFQLLRSAVGTQSAEMLPSDIDWKEVIDLAFEQGVAALTVDGLQQRLEVRGERLERGFAHDGSTSLTTSADDDNDNISDGLELLDSPELEDLKYEWFGEVFRVEEDYQNHLQKVAGLTKLFAEAGFRSCILKGLSNAMLYPNPSHRQCGDIDIWVEGGRKRVLEFLRNRFKVGTAVIHHAHVDIFPDVSVEVHYLPAWLYSPFANRRLQRFFASESETQFSNMTSSGFAVPQPKFNLVFNAVHIYKHYFQGEMTLKHLVDYYCMLQHSSATDRQAAFDVLKMVGLGRFAAWLMGRLERDLGLSPDLALCPASNSETCHRPLMEALCKLPWKVWHWVARRGF